MPHPLRRPPVGLHRCVLAFLLLGCGVPLLVSGCRTSYYTVMEALGQHKRDLLRKALDAAGKEQREAGDQFKDALTELQKLTGFKGGDLQKKYDSFKSEYDQCSSKAGAVKGRIRTVEQLAQDLFAEWQKELREISSPSLRGSSQSKLDETKRRYEQLHTVLLKAERSMDPVLTQMKDYTLYLKHNLNAQAIGSLKTEALNIQDEITRLVSEMNRSIRETESFVSHLGATSP